MYIRDGSGILSDVIYGPDRRSSIDPAHATPFTLSMPPQAFPNRPCWIICRTSPIYVCIASPDARIELMQVYP